jgi:hypothetical protein
MTTISRPSVLDLCTGFSAGLALMPNVRAVGFGLDAVLAPALQAGDDWVQHSAAELTGVVCPGTPLNIDWLAKLLPEGFVQMRPRLAIADAKALPDAEMVYHFDLSTLRAATPGVVSAAPAYQEPPRSARAFEHTRRRFG